VSGMYLRSSTWGSTSNPLLHGHLHYLRLDDIGRQLNEVVVTRYVTTVLIIITVPLTLFLS
jgi:hypothetical protein